MFHTHDALRAFRDSYFDGDGTQMILAAARAFGVAVAYQDRGSIEADVGAFTDEEWETLVGEHALITYDETMEDAPVYHEIAAQWKKGLRKKYAAPADET